MGGGNYCKEINKNGSKDYEKQIQNAVEERWKKKLEKPIRKKRRPPRRTCCGSCDIIGRQNRAVLSFHYLISHQLAH